MRRNPLLAIFTTVFIDLVGFGILIPVFPLLIGEGSPFRVTPESWSFTKGLIMLGWLQAIYPFCTFIASPILGQLSDRFGRRPVLAVSIFGTSIGYVLFAIGIMTANIPLLFAGRALDGFTGGNLAVANAAIGDISTNENRAKNFGALGAAFGLGFIVGPYLGGKLSSPDVSFYGLFDTPSWFGATTPFWFAAILAMLNCVAILTTFPETLKEKFHAGKLNAFQAITNVVVGFKSERLRAVLISGFLFSAGFTFFTTFFGIYLRNNFNFGPSKTGDYFAIVGLFIAFSQAVLVARVSKKLSDYSVLRFSLFGNAAMMMLYFVVPTSFSFGLYLVIPFFTAFNGLTMANMTSLISRSAEPGQQGQAMGIYSSVQSLAQVPASILVGYITTSVTSSQPLVVASVCIALGGLCFVFLFKPTYVSSSVGAPTGAPSH
jgi:MFS transporter, DHA1 family, tetracycline resistance protein